MRILWLAANWIGWNLLCRSLKNLGEHEVLSVRFDPPCAGDKRIPELVRSINEDFDAIIYVGANGGACMPTVDELKILKTFAPSVLLCPEASVNYWWHGLVMKYYEEKCFDIIVNLDGSTDWPYSEYGFTRLTPVDIDSWKIPKPWNERKFLCGIGCNRAIIRREILNILGDMVVWRDSIPPRPEYEEEDGTKTYESYVDFNRDCKSILNMGTGLQEETNLVGLFRTADEPTLIKYGLIGTNLVDILNRNIKGKTHVKGRVIEAALSGSILIEQANSETKKWFIPDEDYLTYSSVDEIKQKISWVGSHPDEAQKIANSLHNKVLREHSPKVFWDDIFNRLFERV